MRRIRPNAARATPIILLAGCLIFVVAKSAAQTLNVPPRPVNAPTGSEFVSIISSMALTERENWIYAQVLSGNIPNFQRTLVPVTASAMIGGSSHTATYYASPDYVAIGTDADYFLEPMTPLLAQRLCDALGCTLPTRKMVNQIWTNAPVKLEPVPYNPTNYNILSVAVFALANGSVRSERDAQTNSHPLGALVSGDKKDVVISSKIYTNLSTPPKPVVIYGWHHTTGVPIQGLVNVHEETYADYSHGARLIQNAITVDGSPNTITSVLTNSSLAGLLSDEGPNEGTTSDHVIRIPRYTIAGLAPVLIAQPRSQTVSQGSSPTYSVVVAGDPPLNYRWRRNGLTVPGATGPSLVVSGAQTTNQGSYTVVVTNAFGSVTSRPALLQLKTNNHLVLFEDDFDSDTSGGWDLYWGAANSVADYTADWAFDYGAIPYTFNGVTGVIPPAPNSPDGSTRAVKLTVNNNDSLGATAAVNLYPSGRSFSGNFALKFDLWINYPGGASGSGSVGSTEYAIFGINHLGNQANWAAPSASSSDGLWFAVDGEGGSTTTDYRAYVGNPAGTPIDLTPLGTSGLAASNNLAAAFQALFPSSSYETPGAPGKSWVQVELRQTNNVVLWLMNDTLVALRTNASAFTSGDVMLGFMDPFTSIASPAKDAFVLFDNVRVESLDPLPEVRFNSATVLPDGHVQLLFSGVPGEDYVIQASTNLVDWQAIGDLTATNGPLPFLDPEAAEFEHRFYRARHAEAQGRTD